MTLHFDTQPIINYDYTPDGLLRVRGTIASVGWLKYQKPDGLYRWEYVSKDCLFDPLHLDSIGGAPVTLQHPSEKVTPKNWKTYAVGSTSTTLSIRKDLGIVDIIVVVGDQDAIKSVEDGETRDLSMGYDVEIDKTNDDSKFIQKNRRCNHNALVTVGRAANASLHLDSWQLIEKDEKLDSIIIDLKIKEKKRSILKWQKHLLHTMA